MSEEINLENEIKAWEKTLDEWEAFGRIYKEYIGKDSVSWTIKEKSQLKYWGKLDPYQSDEIAALLLKNFMEFNLPTLTEGDTDHVWRVEDLEMRIDGKHMAVWLLGLK